MADEKNAIEDKGRRKAIKKIAVGVGALASINALPAQWIRPIVDQIACLHMQQQAVQPFMIHVP